MTNEKSQLCKACAMGTDKYNHTGDKNSCILGRAELIKSLPPEQQMREIIIHERLSQEMAAYIWRLSEERQKTPWEIMEQEGLKLY